MLFKSYFNSKTYKKERLGNDFYAEIMESGERKKRFHYKSQSMLIYSGKQKRKLKSQFWIVVNKSLKLKKKSWNIMK